METLKHKGFTLIELMIVILVIGILASISAPKMVQTRLSFNLSSDLQEMRGAVNRAKVEALKTGKITSVYFRRNPVGAATYTAFVDNNRDGLPNAGETILQNGTLHDTSIMSNPDFNGGASTQFNQLGFPTGIDGLGALTDYSGNVVVSCSLGPGITVYQRLTISRSGQTTITKQSTPFP